MAQGFPDEDSKMLQQLFDAEFTKASAEYEANREAREAEIERRRVELQRKRENERMIKEEAYALKVGL